MNLDTRTVTRDGEAVELTVKEFELLRVLLESAGRLVKRDDLVSEVWDPNWFGSTKTLDVHVSSLRKKLGDDPAAPRYIHTVRGVGFRFSSADELAAVSFRTRLVLAAAYLVAAVVLALEIPLALSIERRADSDFQTDVLGRAALLAARISDEVAAANQGTPSASTRLR